MPLKSRRQIPTAMQSFSPSPYQAPAIQPLPTWQLGLLRFRIHHGPDPDLGTYTYQVSLPPPCPTGQSPPAARGSQ